MEATLDLPGPEGHASLNQEEGVEATTTVPQNRGEPVAMEAEQAPISVTQEVNVNATMLEEMDINRLEVNTSVQTTAPEPSEDVPFVVDVCITKENNPRLEFDPQLVTPAPVRVSSGEEIVFVPRNQRKKKTFVASSATPSKPVLRPGSPHKSSVRVTTPPERDTFFSTTRSVTVIDNPIHVTTHTAIYTGSNQDTPTSKSRKKKERKKARKEKRAQRYNRNMNNDFDDEVVADYIENTNMEELEEFANGAGRRDIGGDNMDMWLDVSDDDGEEEDNSEEDDSEEEDGEDQWDENNLEDFDAISTADEGKGRVHKVLRKRQRPSGVQYLIKWEGTSTDDATWIRAEMLDSVAEKLVKKFEKREYIRELLAQTSEDSDEDEDEDGDGDEDESNEGEDDDQYLQKKKAQEEADFKLACILAKEDEDVLGKYPSASKMANAFSGGWDHMDWASSNNVAPKKKRNKDKAKRTQWSLSDDEHEAQLRSQWDNDRKTKKGKKAEREALRKEGLLGMGGMPGKKDMKAKYTGGMSMAQVHQEIHDFLMNDYPSLALPPMVKAARKAIHNVACALELESKSQGVGKNRFPVLFKTKKTEMYIGNSDLIMQQFARSEKESYLTERVKKPHKLGGGGRGGRGGRGGGGGGGSRGGGGGGGSGSGKHRDGDMVGEHAPEIGLDNKGRRMLEKMGYKAGMGLGAEGNKGIMAPIIAVVKTTRAGLG